MLGAEKLLKFVSESEAQVLKLHQYTRSSEQNKRSK